LGGPGEDCGLSSDAAELRALHRLRGRLPSHVHLGHSGVTASAQSCITVKGRIAREFSQGSLMTPIFCEVNWQHWI
jgi:hypothetical protein